MALDWSPEQLRLLEPGASRPGVVFRLATDPVIRLWAGAVRDLPLAADAVENVEGAVYRSMGLLTDLPPIEQLLNGEARRLEFGLSGAGVTAEVAALAAEEVDAIRSARLNLGLVFFDPNWQIGAPVLWPWEGEADSLTVQWSADGKAAVRALTLSAGSVMTGRRRPLNGIWTDDDQQRRSPGDTFFDQVRRYSEGSSKVWPV